MDISGVATSLNSQGLASLPTTRSDAARPEPARSEAPAEQRNAVRGRRGLALGILRQELQTAIRSFFKAKFAAPAYGGFAVGTDEVADEALAAAKRLVAESPTTATKSLVDFREKVRESSSYAREALYGADDADDIDEVMARVDDGLDGLDDEVSGYRESSASMLAVDKQTRQRSTIQIRTQEGDVVRLSLRRMESLSATDVAFDNGEVSASSTEVAVSSRSRMVMKVEGDLNEAEFAAIQNVFAQAEMIANEFFGGDIGAAFNATQSFEFDTEQLARVNMKFRMREVTNIAYAEQVRTLPGPADPEVLGPVVAPPLDARPVIAEAPVSRAVADEPIVIQPPAPADNETPETAAVDDSLLENFFETLSAFLRSVGEGFAGDERGASIRYHYSESFKLQMLGVVLHTLAPQEVMHAADKAGTLIDSIAAESDDG